MSSYNYDPKVSREEREEEEANLRDNIEQIRVELPRAGYRPMVTYLKRRGIKIGERKLRRVLKKFELQIKPRKRFVRTTDSDHNYLTYPNLLPEMTVTAPDQVWASDITYIRIENGFVFLAVIIDLFSRKIVGWQISKNINSDLTADALEMAIARRKPKPGIIHHSDRGVQYLCDKYTAILKNNKFHISCSAKGNPYDNAWTESFMKTLKDNEVYMWQYKTYLDVLERVPYFLEEVYNKKRVHSSLGNVTPDEFEQQTVGRPTFTL